MKKILIAVPCMDMVQTRFCASLVMLDKVEECRVSFTLNSLVWEARNNFCKQAIRDESDYILWLDSDMTFPRDTLARLLADDKDIVTGLCFRRTTPYTPCLFKELRKTEDEIRFKGYGDDFPRNRLFEVEGCGAAVMLMKTDCLFDIGHDWFTPMKGAGEDTSFCIRAREKGYSIWCDPTIKIGHSGTVTVTVDNYMTMQEVRQC